MRCSEPTESKKEDLRIINGANGMSARESFGNRSGCPTIPASDLVFLL